MHKLFLVGLLSLSSLISLQAQTSIGLDFNYLQSFQEFSYAENEDLASSFGKGDRIHLGFGIQRLKENQTFHEYSFVAYGRAKNSPITDDFEKNAVNLILRWEYGKYFLDMLDKRLQLGGALSLDPSLYRTSFDPTTTTNIPISATRIEVALRIVPRVKLQLSERWSLIAKVPIRFSSLAYEGNLTENSAQTLDENRTEIFALDLGFDRFQANVGLRFAL